MHGHDDDLSFHIKNQCMPVFIGDHNLIQLLIQRLPGCPLDWKVRENLGKLSGQS